VTRDGRLSVGVMEYALNTPVVWYHASSAVFKDSRRQKLSTTNLATTPEW